MTGLPKVSLADVRVHIHRSSQPCPPGRFELNKSVKPSAERAGCESLKLLLTVSPRLTGFPKGSLKDARVQIHKQQDRVAVFSPD